MRSITESSHKGALAGYRSVAMVFPPDAAVGVNAATISELTRNVMSDMSALEQRLTALERGQLPDDAVQTDSEYVKLKSENDRLRYRVKILETAIETELRCPPKQAKRDDSNPSASESISADGTSVIDVLKRVFGAAIQSKFGSVVGADFDVHVVESSKPQFGDYQCNSSMSLAQAVGKAGSKTNPRAVAEAIVSALPVCNLIEKTEIAGPGFINIHLNVAELSRMTADILLKGIRPPRLEHKRVLVDMSSPNIAKEMHVGHLRSTIIGDSLCRLLEFCGFDVQRISHIGDWGTAFGMLIAHLMDNYPDFSEKPPPITDLVSFYKESKGRFDSDEEFKKRAYDCVVRLQAYEPTITKAWELICDVSRQDFEKIYERLDVRVKERGESFYQSMMGDVVKELESAGLVKTEDGRKLVFPPEIDIPLTIVKSDGGYTYDTVWDCPLAAVRHRVLDDRNQWVLYVVDAGQALHLNQVFAVAKQMGWYSDQSHRVEHVPFGLVLGEDKKKLKTRSGETVRLKDLLNEGVKRAEGTLIDKGRDKELTPEELTAARDAVAYGCIKYADLSHNRIHDYVFSFDRMLDDRGNTAVYLLYMYVRIRSIKRKANVSRDDVLQWAAASGQVPLQDAAERALAKALLRLDDVLAAVVKDLHLHMLSEYLYELASVFSEFYNKCYCVEMENDKIKMIHMHRLALCEATGDVMKCGFNILGITPLEKM